MRKRAEQRRKRAEQRPFGRDIVIWWSINKNNPFYFVKEKLSDGKVKLTAPETWSPWSPDPQPRLSGVKHIAEDETVISDPQLLVSGNFTDIAEDEDETVISDPQLLTSGNFTDIAEEETTQLLDIDEAATQITQESVEDPLLRRILSQAPLDLKRPTTTITPVVTQQSSGGDSMDVDVDPLGDQSDDEIIILEEKVAPQPISFIQLPG